MKKIIIFFSLIFLGIIISSFSKDKKNFSTENFTTNEISSVPTEKESLIPIISTIPFTSNSFNGFKEAVGFKESRGKYSTVNSLGYLGKYQFGKSTLNRFKIYDTQLFLETPELQEEAFVALCSLNKWILKRDIKRSVGKTMNDVKITESGILAAAHLAGAGNVKNYLRSNGDVKFKDAYGSSVQHYLKEFSGYDTSFIKAIKKPVLK